MMHGLVMYVYMYISGMCICTHIRHVHTHIRVMYVYVGTCMMYALGMYMYFVCMHVCMYSL